MAERVVVEVDAGVATIRLVRVDAHNAIDPLWVAELGAAVRAVDARPDVRAVLLCADGPSFSVGGDLKHFVQRLERLPEELDAMIGPYHATLGELGALPLPVVCAVQGAVAGGALGLLWVADVVIAADDLLVAHGFARIGMSGDGGSSWALPRLVGTRRAKQLMLGGRTLRAAEALEWGLVDRVVPPAELRADAAEEAARLAAGPTVAFGHMKRLIAAAEHSPWPAQLVAERAAIVDCGRTADGPEGMASFLERRAPEFEGR